MCELRGVSKFILYGGSLDIQLVSRNCLYVFQAAGVDFLYLIRNRAKASFLVSHSKIVCDTLNTISGIYRFIAAFS